MYTSTCARPLPPGTTAQFRSTEYPGLCSFAEVGQLLRHPGGWVALLVLIRIGGGVGGRSPAADPVLEFPVFLIVLQSNFESGLYWNSV